MNLICRIFGHNWKVYHRKKSRTSTELNEFKKCKRCKHTEKIPEPSFIPLVYGQRVKEAMDGQTVFIPKVKTESTPTHPEVAP